MSKGSRREVAHRRAGRPSPRDLPRFGGPSVRRVSRLSTVGDFLPWLRRCFAEPLSLTRLELAHFVKGRPADLIRTYIWSPDREGCYPLAPALDETQALAVSLIEQMVGGASGCYVVIATYAVTLVQDTIIVRNP